MATDAAGRTVWDDKARSDLLMEVIDVAAPSSQEWEDILGRLRVKGYNYTSSAAL